VAGCRELFCFRDQQGFEADLIVPAGDRCLVLIGAKASRTVTPRMAAPLLRLGKSAAGCHVTSTVVDPGRAGIPASSALAPDAAASRSRNNLLVVDCPPGHNTVERLARTRCRCRAEEAGRTPEQRVAQPSPVLNREQTAERLSACEEEIRTLGVTRLALFGSVLRGHTHPQSDVDFLVEFAPGAKSYDRFLALFDLLESRLGRPVELVTREALSPFIGPRILMEAQDVLRAA